jgi:hypothetical protein
MIIEIKDFPRARYPCNVAGFLSEVLVLGVPTDDGGLSIVRPSDKATVGGRMY